MHTQIAPRNTLDDSSPIQNYQTMTRHVMSSREIADLTGKRHDHVMRDIRRMMAELEITDPTFGGSYQDDTGRALPCFFLDRDLTETLITGYNVKLRHRVIKRLRQLEQQQTQPHAIPTNLADALRLAADKAEENERLLGVIQLQAPKVAAIERLAAARGAVCLTDAAKLLQVAPRRFTAWLIDRDWIYQRGKKKRLTAAQTRIDQGFMTHKVTELKPDELTGEPRAVAQPLVTPKGLIRLGEMLQERL
jgi:phage antirepressor YoqD-like protein